MKNALLFGPLLLLCAAVPAATVMAGEEVIHPELSDQEKYIACADCHKETTPEIYQEWYESAHGIGMVKCYQCHGTFETFRTTPAREDCAVCHADMLEKCSQDKACWQCHVPHLFKAAK